MSFQFPIFLIFCSLSDPTLYFLPLFVRLCSEGANCFWFQTFTAVKCWFWFCSSKFIPSWSQPWCRRFRGTCCLHIRGRSECSCYKSFGPQNNRRGRRGGIYRPVWGGTGPEQGTVTKKQCFKYHWEPERLTVLSGTNHTQCCVTYCT
jgi:hypothetical protein